MKARFAGRCSLCKKPFVVGQEISWTPGKRAKHMGCARREPNFQAQASETSLVPGIMRAQYHEARRASEESRRFQGSWKSPFDTSKRGTITVIESDATLARTAPPA